jgi:hypothetical protein
MVDIMTDELKNLMYQLTEQTNKDKKIRGILLCKDKSDMIIASNVCIGDENKCDIKKAKCPDNTIEVGVFRSYPSIEK